MSGDPKERALRALARQVGTWRGDIIVHAPQGDVTNAGTMTCKLVGTWLVRDWGTDVGGFVGHGQYGWDDNRDALVCSWIDSMRTFFATGEGRYDEATASTTWVYSVPLPGKGHARQRDVWEQPAADTLVHRVFVSYDNAPEVENITIRFHKTA